MGGPLGGVETAEARMLLENGHVTTFFWVRTSRSQIGQDGGKGPWGAGAGQAGMEAGVSAGGHCSRQEVVGRARGSAQGV